MDDLGGGRVRGGGVDIRQSAPTLSGPPSALADWAG